MNEFPNLNKISHLIATFFGVGLLPLAPGTWGSIAAFVLFCLFVYVQLSYFLFFLIFLGLTVVAIIACNLATRGLSEKDHKTIVIDEVAGAWLAFLFLPLLGVYDFNLNEWRKESFIAAIVLMVFFRFFDILKPHPISYIDKKFKSGFGIVFDDLIAGVFAGLTLLGGNFFIKFF
jgi:phosphatidylglycerophosphatase A